MTMPPENPSSHVAIFPGTFDPITAGHLDIIARAARMFDHLIVAIGVNPEKRDLFTPEERKAMIEDLLSKKKIIAEVATYQGLTSDFARSRKSTVIVRGIRNTSDLHFEFQLALANLKIGEIETAWIMASEEHGYTSSTLIRQIAAGGGLDRLARLLPDEVLEKMKAKLAEQPNMLQSYLDVNLQR